MFLCIDECHKGCGCLADLFPSRGPCENCGKTRVCADCHTSFSPPAPAKAADPAPAEIAPPPLKRRVPLKKKLKRKKRKKTYLN